MNKLFRRYFMPLLVLVVVFLDEICSCTQIITGWDEIFIKHFWAIILASVSYTLLFVDLGKGKIKNKNIKVLLILLLILFFYVLTSLFYGYHHKYYSYLLVLVAESFSAAFIGMRFAKSHNFKDINNILPFIVIPISLLIGAIGIHYAAIGERIKDDEDSGLGYQTLSYLMAFSYSYACYFVFFKERTHGLYANIMRILMTFFMFYCALVCLVSGGRGAFVFVIFISLFVVFYYLKISKKHHFQAIIIIAFVAVTTAWAINHFNVMESVGMLRVMGRLTEDDNRMRLYESAYTAFMDSPLWGKGLGSVWWTVGFYSHNMLLDLLSEGGIIWTTIILFILMKTLFKLYRYGEIDRVFLFFLIVMLGALVRYTFSSYWVAGHKLFFLCSMMYCLPNANCYRRYFS